MSHRSRALSWEAEGVPESSDGGADVGRMHQEGDGVASSVTELLRIIDTAIVKV